MTFATVETRNVELVSGGDSLTHDITLTAHVAGKYILAVFCVDGFPDASIDEGVSTPGWQILGFAHNTAGGSTPKIVIVGKLATSSSEVLRLITSVAERSQSASFTVLAGGGTLEIELIFTNDLSANAHVSALNPTWGSADTLFIGVVCQDGISSATSPPADWGNLQSKAAPIASNVSVYSAERSLTGTGVADAAFTTTNTEQWVSSTIAFRVVAPDTTPPDITDVDLVPTSENALTGSFGTNEAGKVWAVLVPAAQAAPSEAQIRAGTDVNGDPAVDFIAGQSMSAGMNNLFFTGASPATGYKYHGVAEDLVVPTPNVAAVFSSAEATTDAASEPPVVVISNQTIDGQELTIVGTYSGGVPISSSVFVPAAAVPNGAIDVGPVSFTFAAGAFTIVLSGITPGDYDPPEVTLGNVAGSDTDFGESFAITEMGGEPEAPDPGNTEEAVTPSDTVDGSPELVGVSEEDVTPADSSGAAPTITRNVEEGSGSPIDVATGATTTSVATAEAVTAAETVSKGLSPSVATTESIAAAEAQGRSLAGTVNQSESVTATETPGGSTALGNSVQDVVTTAELSNRTPGITRDTPEVVTAAESQAVTLGSQGIISEAAAAAEQVSGLVVMGVANVEALAGLAEASNGIVSSIVGIVDEVVVLSEQQFQSLLVAGQVEELVAASDEVEAQPIITAITVVEQVNVNDLVSRLLYPKPPGAGSTGRRFIVYYK